jgi:ferrochelatase
LIAVAEVGLVVMAYGTPATPDDIEAYYTHIRRGRAPSDAQLAELTGRYAAIGGTSPLAARTEAQRAALAAALDEAEPGRWQVVLGQKHAPPFIEDAVAGLAANGVATIVGLVLAPHFSRASVGEYQARLRDAGASHGVEVVTIDSWHLEPTYVEFLGATIREGLAGLPERTKVLFTAHSLPERALVDDPYPDQLFASARAAAVAAGLTAWAEWSLAWQSAGRTEDAWRGPDVGAVVEELAGTGRADGVLVCPQGFVSDHLEVVFDLDVECRRRADAAGIAFARTRVLNDDPRVMAALARLVRGAAP